MSNTKTKKKSPFVLKSVRAVGIFKPKFNPQSGRVFSDELNVIGTAFWLKEYKVLITCAHVVQGLLDAPVEVTGLLVVGDAGNYQRAVVNSIDLQHDLATLRLIGNNNKPLPDEELEKEAKFGLSIVDEYANVGTGVSYAGFPLGNQLLDSLHSPTYAEGVVGIKKKDGGIRRDVQISGAAVGGFSGSPVVLKEYPTKLIGVVARGPQQAANIFMAVAWEHVKAVAELANS